MAKKEIGFIKLQIPAGKANPAPPVGPALGQHGVNIMGFVKEYNEKTSSMSGTIVPVEITVFEDVKFSPLHVSKLCKIISIVISNQNSGIYNLGWNYGMKKFLQSNGEYNPSDSVGTSLTDYLNKFK